MQGEEARHFLDVSRLFHLAHMFAFILALDKALQEIHPRVNAFCWARLACQMTSALGRVRKNRAGNAAKRPCPSWRSRYRGT